MQRFQLAVYPDISKDWRNVDHWPDTDAKNRAFETIRRLDQMRAGSVGADIDEHDVDGIPFLRFSHEAQECFDSWREGLEKRLRSRVEHPAMEAHLAKYRSLIPSLALLSHLADGGTGPVTLAHLERAIAWGAGDVRDGFGLRDVYRHGWIGLGTREAVARAVDVLCDLDWLREEVEPTSGRSRTRYALNPKLVGEPKYPTDKADRS